MAAQQVAPEVRVETIERAFRGSLGFPFALARSLAVAVAFLAAVLVARQGTDFHRIGAGAAFVAALLVSWLVHRVRSKKWRAPRSALYHALRRVDEAEAARAARAYGSYERVLQSENSETAHAGESLELARLHVGRVLDRFPEATIRASSRALRKWVLRGAFLLFSLTAGLLLTRPLVVIEGVDVMFARKGVGPFPVSYVGSLSMTIELPSYLDGTGKKHPVFSHLLSIPQGSEIEVRILPAVSGRRLLLTDGMNEAPLVSDGQGGLVGRWVADQPASLRVAARFGDVLIFDGNETLLAPVEDRKPQVQLSGAPASRELADLDELELDYLAMDDHGLTQVDLVIRSGQKTHREELAHLDGQRRTYQGAHRLTKEHEMLRRAFLPVHVRVEARDGNTATGPSWGKSQAITLLPEPLGKESAERHQRLRHFREALTTYLAKDIQASHLSIVDAKKFREEARAELTSAFEALEANLLESVNVPEHSLAFLEGQLEALTRKGAERSTSESVLLAADALVQTLGDREAVDVAKDLGAAVEEIAVQARQIRARAEGVDEQGLRDLLLGARLGALQLKEVGNLGLDLGSVAIGDLARVEATVNAGEFGKTEAAALHLAERLKRATPSFGSKGGAVEAGMPAHGGGGQGEGPPSDAPGQFDDMSKQLDDLASDAASELSELERMLRDAQRAAEADFEPSSNLDEVADELREAMEDLSGAGIMTIGPRGDASAARGFAEAMAEALEGRAFDEAVERGLDADEALRRAEKSMEESAGWLDERALERARAALDRALEEAKKASEQLAESSKDSVADSLADRAQKQRGFSERAKELARRGAQPDAPLPQQSLEALRRAAELLDQAARAMEAGKGREGAERAGEAQSELERAIVDPSDASGDSEGGHSEGDSELTRGEADVPEEDKDRARDFRERVERGLGRNSGRLAPAVRRYAEELK